VWRVVQQQPVGGGGGGHIRLRDERAVVAKKLQEDSAGKPRLRSSIIYYRTFFGIPASGIAVCHISTCCLRTKDHGEQTGTGDRWGPLAADGTCRS
jgi:hypothetical protein